MRGAVEAAAGAGPARGALRGIGDRGSGIRGPETRDRRPGTGDSGGHRQTPDPRPPIPDPQHPTPDPRPPTPGSDLADPAGAVRAGVCTGGTLALLGRPAGGRTG